MSSADSENLVSEDSRLCPAQHKTMQILLESLRAGDCFVITAADGAGKTTVLREAHRRLGGVLVTIRDVVDAMQGQHPLAIEETLMRVLWPAIKSHDVVLVDDLHLIYQVVCRCGGSYPRAEWIDAPLTVLTGYAAEAQKKLIFASGPQIPSSVRTRSYVWQIPSFKPIDYDFLCRAVLGDTAAERLDFEKIYRFAPKLDGHQLKAACSSVRYDAALDTERFIEYLRSQRMASNVDLEEVQVVELRDLKGVDDVIAALEANIIIPLENDKLAAELNIKPKRGVLLAGAPGTGKTTIGRALARRLKGKFFLIDGTFISGTHHFYSNVAHIFEQAKQNSPSVIFIDDSDVIFENGEEMGLYRYLLTMLDGLESESAARVCVMMTAMDVGSLPPALIRSGRIELWLETRLPDEAARRAILEQQIADLPARMGTVDVEALATATDGLTGADLKRLIEDGKLLFAYDTASGKPVRAATEYFVGAVETVRSNKQRYAEAEARARKQRPVRPPWFSAMPLDDSYFVANGGDAVTEE